MKKQVVVIHGGDTFETYEEYLDFLKKIPTEEIDEFRRDKKLWKQNLREDLGSNYDVVQPEMPNAWSARFIEWQIWFEKLLPFLQDEIVLVGHSLGGSFLAKYLSENKFSKKISGVFLVAAPFGDNSPEYKLLDFTPPEKINLQGEKVYFYHSKDDKVVPFSDLAKYKNSILEATVRTFEDKGHFIIEHFPELVDDIKNL